MKVSFSGNGKMCWCVYIVCGHTRQYGIHECMYRCIYMHVCVRVCTCACVRACVRASLFDICIYKF